MEIVDHLDIMLVISSSVSGFRIPIYAEHFEKRGHSNRNLSYFNTLLFIVSGVRGTDYSILEMAK